MADDWIEWKGGKCPVHGRRIVEVLTESGETMRHKANDLDWNHSHDVDKIVKYRTVNKGKSA